MAEASLNFNEDSLDQSSGLYDLYQRFYNGMRAANEVDAPNFTVDPPLTDSGQIDSDAILAAAAEYSAIQMKNSAYMMANAIMSMMSGGDASVGSNNGYIARSGDSMTGLFSALYGFKAGSSGTTVLNIPAHIVDQIPRVEIEGQLDVALQIQAQQGVNIGGGGVYFNGSQTIYDDAGTLHLSSNSIALNGPVTFLTSWAVGQTKAAVDGLWYGDKAYYHGGNSNNQQVDWAMRNGHVYGDLAVHGTTSVANKLTATGGFSIGSGGVNQLYSSSDNASVILNSDLSIVQGNGIKFGDTYILSVRNNNIVSLSAPGRILNLGDSGDEGVATQHIALQTGIYQYNGEYRIVSQYGDGNFRNSLSAGCGNANSKVLETYYKAPDDCGVVFYENVRLGSATGPSLSADDAALQFRIALPYLRNTGNANLLETLPITFQHHATTSLFKDQSLPWSASLHIDTEAELIAFQKPIEATSVAIISENYKTQLIENVLFFGDNAFFEGVADGIRHAGNAYFDSGVSSKRFASGFAGYGWAIREDLLYGGIAATFDELTVRKKMRIYELEVQKASVTTGSLWVSNSCSGDTVEEII